MKNKKQLLSLLLAGTLVFSQLAACGSNPADTPTGDSASEALTMETLKAMDWAEIEAAAKAEGELNFSVWYNEANFTELLKLFTAKYGIKVNLVVSEQKAFVQKVLAEKDGKVGTIDAAMIGGEMVKTLLDAGAMAGPILDKMEQKDLLDPALSEYQEGMATNGYLIPFLRNQTGFLYNSEKIAEADLPQTWADLEKFIKANPMKFGVCPPESGGSGQSFTMLAIQELTGGLDQYYGDTTIVESKIANWDNVWTWFNANKGNITMTTSNNDSLSRLNQGELYLTPVWDDDSCVARAAGELSDTAKMYVPEMGLAGGGDCIGVLGNAENKAAALLLMNWMTSDEAQTEVAKLLNSIPARTDIPAETTLIAADQMQYRTAWIPAVYKLKFIQDFTTFVLRA